MTRPTTIKVIKRGQMELSREKTEIAAAARLNERGVRREAAAAIEGWIAEFQKTRRSAHLAAKQQLDR